MGLLLAVACTPGPARRAPSAPASLPRCATAVACHIEGLGWLRRDDPRGIARLHRLCRGELEVDDQRGARRRIEPYGPSCLALGKLREATDRNDEAGELYRQGCAVTGDARCCRRLGELVLDADPERAETLLGKGCELGDSKSCLLLGARYQELADAGGPGRSRSELLDRAGDAYERACGMTGNHAVCQTGSDLHTAALAARDTEERLQAEEQAQREAREAADRAARKAEQKRQAARWAAAVKQTIPVTVTSSLRCEDGGIDRFPAQDDVLHWVIFPDGALQARLASWNGKWRVTRDLVFKGARGGRSASLTAHLTRNRWVWIYELEAKTTRNGRFRSAILKTQYSTGEGNDCVSTSTIERSAPRDSGGHRPPEPK